MKINVYACIKFFVDTKLQDRFPVASILLHSSQVGQQGTAPEVNIL